MISDSLQLSESLERLLDALPNPAWISNGVPGRTGYFDHTINRAAAIATNAAPGRIDTTAYRHVLPAISWNQCLKSTLAAHSGKCPVSTLLVDCFGHWYHATFVPLLDALSRPTATLGVAHRLTHWSEVLSLLAGNPALSKDLARRSLAEAPRWLSTVKARLDRNPTTPLDISELADRVHVHPDHLTRIFRKYHGMSIREYRKNARLKMIAETLVNSTETISEIAAAAGFADQSHMTRELKAAFGMSPKRFRQQFSAAELPALSHQGPARRSFY